MTSARMSSTFNRWASSFATVLLPLAIGPVMTMTTPTAPSLSVGAGRGFSVAAVTASARVAGGDEQRDGDAQQELGQSRRSSSVVHGIRSFPLGRQRRV